MEFHRCDRCRKCMLDKNFYILKIINVNQELNRTFNIEWFLGKPSGETDFFEVCSECVEQIQRFLGHPENELPETSQ